MLNLGTWYIESYSNSNEKFKEPIETAKIQEFNEIKQVQANFESDSEKAKKIIEEIKLTRLFDLNLPFYIDYINNLKNESTKNGKQMFFCSYWRCHQRIYCTDYANHLEYHKEFEKRNKNSISCEICNFTVVNREISNKKNVDLGSQSKMLMFPHYLHHIYQKPLAENITNYLQNHHQINMHLSDGMVATF